MNEATILEGHDPCEKLKTTSLGTAPRSVLVYRFNNTFTSIMIDGILVRNQNGHHFKTSQTGLER